MDIEKEREAFSRWVLKHPDNLDITSYEENIMFDAWQAAKASAVPDGYCVVPKEPTKAMLIAADNCEIDVKVTAHNIYKAMLAASQEPAND